MKSNTIWSVFLIASVLGYVHCIPVQEPGNSYKLEILSKNNHSPPTSTTSSSGSILDKLDFSKFFESFATNVVPTLLAKHESGSVPGKETTHQLGKSVTESLTKSLSDVFSSKLGQEILITAGLKKRPTLMETIYQTLVEYLKWIATATTSKIHDLGQKGLFATVSDTFYGMFGTHSTPATAHTHQSSQQIHYKPDTWNEKPTHKHSSETYLEPRGLLDRMEERIEMSRGRGGGGLFGGGGGFGSSRYQPPGGPWNTLFYRPYDPNYPYSTLPPFMGGGPIAYFGYLITTLFYAIQEFFGSIFSRGPPMPPPRHGFLRRPPQYY